MFNKIFSALQSLSQFAQYIPIVGQYLPAGLALMKAGHDLITAANPGMSSDDVVAHAMQHFGQQIVDDENIKAQLSAEIATPTKAEVKPHE